MTIFRTIYIDMDAFFASVEQQMDPALRGKPVAITAVDEKSGCVVAASYEAKSYSVRTGTRVYEARRLCPQLQFRPSRHPLYVKVNQKIARVVDSMAELEYVRSVDEFQVALGGKTASLDQALSLARQIKKAIATQVGSQLRCSIGIGPNQLLAKIAGKLEKPDGLQWLAPENMPDRLSKMKLEDLPGISQGISKRLYKARIYDIPSLYNLDPRHARLIWHSVEGERFVRALQGENIPLQETKRNSYGNSKVLAPQYRVSSQAKLVGRWLVEKAVERMRRDGYCAKRFSLQLRFLPSGGWSQTQSCVASQDTALFLSIYEHLWQIMIKRRPYLVGSISVQLTDVLPLAERSGELFNFPEPGKPNPNEKLATAVDQINRRYKTRLVHFGVNQEHPGFFENGSGS
ncbi:DNA polymerase IV [Pseudovibrio sp. Ad5]|uniref:Y-family DNA polymerase n=2 Tax=unclassified Pseudovibrio TaxID=2627060 RepID=UPI0007AE6354|nr:UMUC-like DNA-repair protein [Pseudovibrio sp. Ad5]KZK98967.1 DNA polymerase IV [Pseudovibrio sp. Ad5]